jgi:hypothetical protein
MSGSIDDEICWQRFAPPSAVRTSDRRNRSFAGVVMNLCALQLSRTSILRYSTKAFTHSEFKQWPRQAVDRDAEIPPRKGVISRELSEIVVTHAKPHGSGPRKALYKTGE